MHILVDFQLTLANEAFSAQIAEVFSSPVAHDVLLQVRLHRKPHWAFGTRQQPQRLRALRKSLLAEAALRRKLACVRGGICNARKMSDTLTCFKMWIRNIHIRLQVKSLLIC